MGLHPRIIANKQKNNKKCFESNQKSSGEIIIDLIRKNGKRYIDFEAQMQSGKTGAYLWVALMGLYDETFTNVVILCGESQTSLRKQMKDDKKSYIRSFKNTHLKDLDDEVKDDLCDYFEEHITIIMRQDLTKKDEESVKKRDLLSNPEKNTLLIWDESHYANSANQTIDKFFQEIGIKSAFVDDIKNLQEKGLYVITSSATKSAERIASINTSPLWGFVRMTPGDTYKGVEYFYTNGNIRNSFKLDSEENETKFKSIIKKYIEEKKYFIVRTMECEFGYNSLEIVKRIIAEIKDEGYDIDSLDIYGDQLKKITKESGCKYFEKEPDKFTIALIKGCLRMGDDVHKEHICAAFEYAESPFHDTLLQSLLGRMCGYNHNENIHIYLPETFIESGIPEFIRNQKAKLAVPITHTNQVSKDKIVKHFGTIPYVIKAGEIEDIIDVIKAGEIEDIIEENTVPKHSVCYKKKSLNRDQFKKLIKDHVLAKLNEMGIPDVQKTYILENINSSRVNSSGRITFSNSHQKSDTYKKILPGAVTSAGGIYNLYKHIINKSESNQNVEKKGTVMNIMLVNNSYASEDSEQVEFPELSMGDIIITFFTGSVGPGHKLVPKAAGPSVWNEVQLETKTKSSTKPRGGQKSRYPEDAHQNPESLRSFLSLSISNANTNPCADRSVSYINIDFEHPEKVVNEIIKGLQIIAPKLRLKKKPGRNNLGGLWIKFVW